MERIYNIMNKEIYNIILIHTARTWERIRITQTHQEMPFDNIGSTDEIEKIATMIYHVAIIQGFLTIENTDNYWVDNTDEGMSDTYIEGQAEQIILDEYLN
jgi:hypothetical protein